MPDIVAIPALRDNYIWVIRDARHAVLVDPGEAEPALTYLRQEGLDLAGILCTHRHADHIGGIAALRGVYTAPVYGRMHPGNPHITHDVNEGSHLTFEPPAIALDVIAVPGHLVDHVAFVADGAVFCGDVLFGAGCGRNFEGTTDQLYHSLQRLAALPGETRVYCAHEYTLANLHFAMACEPDNDAIEQRLRDTEALRLNHRPTLPSTIALERATNPFLRCDHPNILATLRARGMTTHDPAHTFAALRTWRNEF